MAIKKRFPYKAAFVACNGGCRATADCQYGCVGCELCVNACKFEAIALNDYGVAEVNEDKCIVDIMLNVAEFFLHESCGQCTPCREGTYWMKQIMKRLEAGKGRPGDIELLDEVAGNILGRSFCALGDAAATPVKSAISLFREEFELGMTTPAWEAFPYEKSTVVASGGAK